MLGKNKTAPLVILFLLACAATVSAASSYINELGLSRDGSFTVLTIKGSDQLRYAHQSVEAKEGKPFRVVIDCLASRHGLPQKKYASLPSSVITSIRTSQYSVNPEEVVRIVLDLNEESVYRVEAAGNAIKVFVSDQKTAPFPQWISKGDKAPTVATSNPAVKADQRVEKKPVPRATIAQKPKDSAKPESGSSEPSVSRKPSVMAQADKKESATVQKPSKPKSPKPKSKLSAQENTTVASKVEAKAKPVKSSKASRRKPVPTVASTETKPVFKPDNKSVGPVAMKDLANDSIEKARFFASVIPVANNIPEPGEATDKDGPKSEDIHKKSAVSKSVEPKKSTPPPVKNNREVVLASTDQSQQPPDAPGSEEVEKIRTSKYRRESSKAAEMKATKVVQFPQRMVIKYKRNNARDPFESLITIDRKKKGNVDLNKIPNVETLHLVGILEPVSGKGAALMEDLDGIGYILRPGDRVRNGYVAQIDKQAIYFQINEYGWGRTLVKHMEKDN
jgi:hypothetical protein